jgi:hypothetical protein
MDTRRQTNAKIEKTISFAFMLSSPGNSHHRSSADNLQEYLSSPIAPIGIFNFNCIPVFHSTLAAHLHQPHKAAAAQKKGRPGPWCSYAGVPGRHRITPVI